MLRFKLHHLFACSLLVTILYHRPARAMGVQFDLDGHNESPLTSQPITDIAQSLAAPEDASKLDSETAAEFTPLPIPPNASQPPIRHSSQASHLPNHVLASARRLTPPPAAALPRSRVLEPISRSAPATAIALSFTPNQTISRPSSSPTNEPSQDVEARKNTVIPTWIYQGGSDSLVARVIGKAEGTRTASGNHTKAYYGHTDPGNGVWNMGTFSYQHGASSPQEADKKQLKRLKKQGKAIAQQADQADLTMSLGEVLNGLDLANQSPRAALERGGYIDRLVQARQKGMDTSDAIIWARTYAYLDPDTQRWNAPGLGNTLASIRRDQSRRHEAVAQAFDHYQAQRLNTDQSPADTLAVPMLALAQPPMTKTPADDISLSQPNLASKQAVESNSMAFNIHASTPYSEPEPPSQQPS
ncbi:hypothetical protein N836_02445 [Leptolyngbya sp. Heron Island J]|uniref:hypothetical protein n=1 Tax=Leptolyngbya sp. Heron Island J TaxID=1385935 RepID=UPI0003B9C985|nr:hypothetical protein [Leptolyngbya sp. Heron Island J]ESA38380.1 hypothetical protein N836_02445 [Leptolyngbya sp. Heron Island J]